MTPRRIHFTDDGSVGCWWVRLVATVVVLTIGDEPELRANACPYGEKVSHSPTDRWTGRELWCPSFYTKTPRPVSRPNDRPRSVTLRTAAVQM